MSLRSHYGFKPRDDLSTDTLNDFTEEYSKVLDRRESRWDITNILDPKKFKRSKRLKSFCRKGIPQKYRIRVWMMLTEAETAMANNQGLYEKCLRDSVPQKYKSVIDVDIPRTFPENEFFSNENSNKSRIIPLRNVLYAFTNKNKSIGYCQGLNYIAASILLAFEDNEPHKLMEEKTFWIMNQLIEKIIPNYYGDDMANLTRDCLVMEDLLQTRMKDVYNLLKRSQIDMVMIATKWFICCFADVVPIETVFRIFDCLFYEGDKILFRAALTLIKLHKDDILKDKDLPSVMRTFKSIGMDEQTLYCHEFIHNMFAMNTNFKRSEIERYRQNHEATLRYNNSFRVRELAKEEN